MAEAALRTARVERPPQAATVRVETDKLTAMYGKFTAVKGVSLGFPANRVHALIGPSGCGKSTFLRTLNRMHELSDHGWITGRVLLDEPTASLDPQGTQRIEELLFDLKQHFTIIIVTHNMQQAARVADSTAFMLTEIGRAHV